MVWQHEESNEISRMNPTQTYNSDKPYRLTHRLSTFSVDNSGLKTDQIRALLSRQPGMSGSAYCSINSTIAPLCAST
ncbi:hypothetical protein CRM79_00515 [Pantoea agglomerans]|nr:hypothetical protein CRM79_00515 [Pantoea agglomerans]